MIIPPVMKKRILQICLAVLASLSLTACLFERQLSDVERECLDMYQEEVFRDAQYELVVQDIFEPILVYFKDHYMKDAADAYVDPLLNDYFYMLGAEIGESFNSLSGHGGKTAEERIFERVEDWASWCEKMAGIYEEKLQETIQQIDSISNRYVEDEESYLDIEESYFQSEANLRHYCERFFSNPKNYRSVDMNGIYNTLEGLAVTWLGKYDPVVPKLIKVEHYEGSVWRLIYDNGEVKSAEFVEEESGETWVLVEDHDPRYF